MTSYERILKIQTEQMLENLNFQMIMPFNSTQRSLLTGLLKIFQKNPLIDRRIHKKTTKLIDLFINFIRFPDIYQFNLKISFSVRLPFDFSAFP